jgi:hypothetical protein
LLVVLLVLLVLLVLMEVRLELLEHLVLLEIPTPMQYKEIEL